MIDQAMEMGSPSVCMGAGVVVGASLMIFKRCWEKGEGDSDQDKH